MQRCIPLHRFALVGGLPLFSATTEWRREPTTMHRLDPAHAADLFEGPTPEERTLTDYCRTPFSFGLVLLIPVTLMVWAFVDVMHSRPVIQILNKPQAMSLLELLAR